MKRLIWCLGLLIIYVVGGYVCYQKGLQSGNHEVVKLREQLEISRQTLENSPYARVCRINSRYRALLKRFSIDPEAYGVTE